MNKGRDNHNRGDEHWTRINPERLARGLRSGKYTKPESTLRGDRHWTRFKPEAAARGERQGSAKLTEDRVRIILSSVEPASRLAAMFGVSKSAVEAVRRRLTWRHVK